MFTNVSTWSITVNRFANGNPSWTEYYVECSSVGAGFQPTVSTSGWITQLYWTATNLSANTSYYFQIKARNYDSVETSTVSFGWKYTLPTDPKVYYTGQFISSDTYSAKINVRICTFTATADYVHHFRYYWGTEPDGVPTEYWDGYSTGVVSVDGIQ
jgi:hypothetical protein